MKTSFGIKDKLTSGFILKSLALLLLLAIGLWLLDTIGIAPYLAAFILIFFRGLLRFLFQIICFLVSIGILIWLLTLIL